MALLRRYCWRFGICVTIEDDERCSECSEFGDKHITAPFQDKCCEFAPITKRTGGPCILPIGHEGPHVAHPEQIEEFRQKGEEILVDMEDEE
jgi:hypothetical protein